MSDKKDEAQKPEPAHEGRVAVRDVALAEWLLDFWEEGNRPDSLEVHQMVGPKKSMRGDCVFAKAFKASDDYDIEKCGRLANQIYADAQNDCNNVRAESSYQVTVLDTNRKGEPLKRRLSPLFPTQIVLARGDGHDADEDEIAPGIKSIVHVYLDKMAAAVHRRMENLDLVAGDIMSMQQGIIANQQNYNHQLQQNNMALYGQLQESLNQSQMREIWAQKEQMKIKAIGSGLKVGENLLYSWFGSAGGEDEGKQVERTNTAQPRRHLGSREQMLASSFLSECGEEKISVALFGDWADTDNLTLADIFSGTGLKAPGIFTPQQFGVIVAVSQGEQAASALDALMEGGVHAITMEQLIKAQPLFTQSMGLALQQIKSLRDKARESKVAKTETGGGAS